MNENIKRLSATALAAMLLIAGVTMVAGTAAAHTCKAYDDCDASACKDGEDHEHTDQNYWPKRDESCKSTAAQTPPGSCKYLEIEFPPLVCKLLDPGAGATPPETPRVCTETFATIPTHSDWAAPIPTWELPQRELCSS